MALQGAIESFGIARVLQYLSLEPNSSRLHVTGDLGTMNVWLADGALVVPWTDEGDEPALRPAETVFRLLRFTTGTFVVVEEAVPTGTVARQPFAEALASAHAMLAEWPELQRIVLGPDATVSLARRLPNGGFDLSADDWKVLAFVGGGTTVRALVRRLGLGQFDGLRRVAALVRGGLAEIQLPQPASAPTPATSPLVATAASPSVTEASAPATVVTAAPVSEPDAAAAGQGAMQERRKEVLIDSWTGEPLELTTRPEVVENELGAFHPSAARSTDGPARDAAPVLAATAPTDAAPAAEPAAAPPRASRPAAPPPPPTGGPALSGHDPEIEHRDVRRPATAVARLVPQGGPTPPIAPPEPPASPTRIAAPAAQIPAVSVPPAPAAAPAPKPTPTPTPVAVEPTPAPVPERQPAPSVGVRGSIPASSPNDSDVTVDVPSGVAKRPEELIAAAMAARLAEDRAERAVDPDATVGDDALNRALLYKFLSSVRS